MDSALYGSGSRHRPRKWSTSCTGYQHKTIFAGDAGANKKFVMVFGDSHLRSLADGFVTMPLGNLRFGFSSTPGACAAILRKDILRETLPEEPDLVVILAPGNNLTKSNTIEQAGKEFATLIHSAQHRWNKATAMAPYCGDILIKHLEGLRNTEFKRFRSKLKSYEEGNLQIPRCRLERAGVDETVELLIQCFVIQAVPVAVEVLKRCNINKVAHELHSEWEKECKKRKSEPITFEEDEVKSIKLEPHLYARPTKPAPGVSSETGPSEACGLDSPIPEDCALHDESTGEA